MPLLDHFHGPLRDERHWESFHAAWATTIMRTFNRQLLPKTYIAEAQVHVGPSIEVDVATFENDAPVATMPNGDNGGGVAVQTLAPPTVTISMPTVFPDEIEVQVFTTGATLVGAIEFLSPRNKDRPEARRAFAIKCAAYLQQKIGLIIVDVVTDRLANMHNELIDLLDQPANYRFAQEITLYAVAYRPIRRKKVGEQLDLWMLPLALGQPLPTMPLALRDGPVIAVDLESSYSEARLDSRL